MKNAVTGLTFSWPDARHVSFALPGFILLSLFGHAASFYLFQIAWPPSAHIVPPPAQVSLLAPDSPGNATLLRWIEAEDPAVIAQPPEVLPAHLFDQIYQPSFAEVRTQPIAAAGSPPDLSYPSALPPFAWPTMEKKSTAPLPASPSKTVVHFHGALAHRAVSQSAPAAFHSETAEVKPARFLIGVSDRGEVRYIFLQSGSGDSALDAQAEAQLRQTEFVRDTEPLSWGMVIFAWGGEIFRHTEPATKTSPHNAETK